MIFDTFDNARLYEDILPGITALVAYAQTLKNAPAGRYALDGSEHFVLIQEMDTRGLDGAAFEAHKKHADVQMLLDGNEVVRWAPLDALRVTDPYDSERDALFAVGDGVDFAVKPGLFYLLLPGDAHAPLGGVNGVPGLKLRKAVGKLRIAD